MVLTDYVHWKHPLSRYVAIHVYHPPHTLLYRCICRTERGRTEIKVTHFSIDCTRTQCNSQYSRSSLPPSQKADILRALLLILSAVILLPSIDPSKIYHSIRGQDTIKLYVIFNALEVWDTDPLAIPDLSDAVVVDCGPAPHFYWTRRA